MTMQDGGIDLSFGPESVKPSEYEPLDEGIYSLFVSNVELKTTAAGESMIVLEWTVTGPVRAGSMIRNDNLVIPGAKRKAEDPDKWNMMMNMLRDRLEAITGQNWRDDNMKLNPSSLSGCPIKAIVLQQPYDYTKDGERKVGVGNYIKKYLRPDDTTTTFTPSQPAQMGGVPSAPQAPGLPPSSPAPDGQGGGFAL